MFALARLLVVGFVVCTLVYICLSLYSRSVRRDKLETEWREGDTEGANIEEYVQKGLKDYDGSLRRKLTLGVYVVPFCIVSFIIYATNFM